MSADVLRYNRGDPAVMALLDRPAQIDDALLRPGASRAAAVDALMERLMEPAALDQLLARLQDLSPQAHEVPEEQHAHGLALLLRQIGVNATPDVIRGSATSSESLSFLNELITLVKLKDSAGEGSDDPLAACTPLLDFACANFPRLTSDSRQLFPSDITRAISHNLVHADDVLASCDACAAALASDAERLRNAAACLPTSVGGGSPSLTAPPPTQGRAEWAAHHADISAALSVFLESVARFSDVYASELGMWCSRAPSAHTHGLGARAAALLQSYQQLLDMASDVKAVRRAHAAVAGSAAPLVAFQPSALRTLAERAHVEAGALAAQVAVMHKAVQQERGLQRGEHQGMADGSAAATLDAMDMD